METAAEPSLAATGLELRHRGAHPTRGRVRLTVEVDTPTSLRVDLVDLQGRVVARVHNGPLAEGAHDLGVAADLPAGMYVAHAIAEDGRTTRLPVVIVR